MSKYVTTAYWPSGSVTTQTHSDWDVAFNFRNRLIRPHYNYRPDIVTITPAQEEKPDLVSALTKIMVQEVRSICVGQIITIDGTHPGTSKDGSWHGDYFKVLSIDDDLEFTVKQLVDFSRGYRDGKDFDSSLEPMVYPPLIEEPFQIDSKHFIIRLVTPEEVIKAMLPLTATFEDHERRRKAKNGFRMVSREDRKRLQQATACRNQAKSYYD